MREVKRDSGQIDEVEQRRFLSNRFREAANSHLQWLMRTRPSYQMIHRRPPTYDRVNRAKLTRLSAIRSNSVFRPVQLSLPADAPAMGWAAKSSIVMLLEPNGRLSCS